MSRGIWQSFTPAWSSQLTEVDIFFGAGVSLASQCVPYQGTFSVYRGSGRTAPPFFAAANLLYTAPYTGHCNCNEHGCISWESIILSAPIAVEADQVYSISLSGASLTGVPYRVGIYVADVYQRGSNDFATPGYDLTFRTYLQTVSYLPTYLDECRSIYHYEV